MADQGQSRPGNERKLDDLVFVGFNARVAALDRYSGNVVWQWKAPKGTGFVSLHLDGDRLIVSVQGYTYCLDPLFGQEVWSNPLKGFGLGIASLASARGANPASHAAGAAARRQAAGAAAAGTAAVG